MGDEPPQSKRLYLYLNVILKTFTNNSNPDWVRVLILFSYAFFDLAILFFWIYRQKVVITHEGLIFLAQHLLHYEWKWNVSKGSLLISFYCCLGCFCVEESVFKKCCFVVIMSFSKLIWQSKERKETRNCSCLNDPK